MKKHLFITPLLSLIFAVCQVGFAQVKTPPKTISGGVLNGKAISLAKPVYPQDAIKARISGTVKVQVLIDENGKVISAKALDGPVSASLGPAAEAAALQAVFSPTLLQGKPAKVSGVIDYNFVLQSTNEEKLKFMGLGAMLTLVRSFASDTDQLKVVFGEKDAMTLIKEASEEFGQFAGEIEGLSSLDKMPVEKRVEAIDAVFSSVEAKSSPADRWQLGVERNLGEIFVPLMHAVLTEGEDFDVTKLDWSGVRLNVEKIRDQMLSVPPDFPPDVLAKFKDLVSDPSKVDLADPVKLAEFFQKMVSLIDTISPETTK